uniref:BTB domain-containing protein n=1 Tax=Panagrolaimus sp. ES5 TaxID=591445 RepID=A0AC34FMZ8_9BILA
MDPEKKFFIDDHLTIETKGVLIEQEEFQSIKDGHLGKSLWKDDDDKDFVIAVGKKNEIKEEIKATTRSPVFKRMIKTDMKEKAENKVEIIDFDFETVVAAIAFCYDRDYLEGIAEWKKLVTLHQFADKYDIQDFKKPLELHLMHWISFENICEITNAAIMTNYANLQKFCFDCLLMALRNGIPVKDFEKLDNDFSYDLLTKAFSVKHC